LRIAAVYSHKNGVEVMQASYPHHPAEITNIIQNTDAEQCRTKISEEITMPGATLYSPPALNGLIKRGFQRLQWMPMRLKLSAPFQQDLDGHEGFREIDFVKDRIGIEVQFGKYSFLPYDVVVKMIIFHRAGLIEVGVEIVPVKRMTTLMSTGIGHFQQLVTDLHYRGTADIDIPVMIIGVDTDRITL